MTGYVCAECGTSWGSLAAADGCATIDAAADRAARQQRGARVDNGIVKSPEHGNPTA